MWSPIISEGLLVEEHRVFPEKFKRSFPSRPEDLLQGYHRSSPKRIEDLFLITRASSPR